MGDVAMSIPERIASLGLLKAPPPAVAVNDDEVRAAPWFTVEAAWFATMTTLAARRDGCRLRPGPASQADDVVKALDHLYRQRRIELAHARVLRVWGERGEAPNAAAPHEREDARLWAEAMDRLQLPLRMKIIVR